VNATDDIYRIKFSDVTIWQNELLERYNSLLHMGKELPSSINPPSYTESDNLKNEDIVKWFDSVKKEAKDDAPPKDNPDGVQKVALALALCGWSGEKLAGVQFAYCTKCFSRVGFWLYRMSNTDDEALILDPISLHRAHCPWQNPQSQCGLGDYSGLAAWQIMGRVISIGVSRTQRNKRASARVATGESVDDGAASIDYRPSTGMSTLSRTREEVDLDDKMRESKLARLKKAFTVRRAKSRTTLTSSANTSRTGL
jgi:hypothetical protein